MKSKQEVVSAVEHWAKWWIGQRRKKLEDQLNETMSVNPFMMPFLFDYHNLDDFSDLADLIIASHLMTGHNTGFGKLIDEKILPGVFDAHKLDTRFRKANPPFNESCFDEIDHYIVRQDGTRELLSLKAGRWTIQLTMAVQLNAAFNEILTDFPGISDSIVVGVFYGKKESLTDKYDILRGENRGANHDVIDLTANVNVYAGKEFWMWLNDGEADTQLWVLEGIKSALDSEKIHETASALLDKFKRSVVDKYENDVRDENGVLDWNKLLTKING